jgi:hypothetical protein
MHLATILVEKNSKLRALNHRRRRRKNKRQQYIARGGALQAKEGRTLATAANIGSGKRD